MIRSTNGVLWAALSGFGIWMRQTLPVCLKKPCGIDLERVGDHAENLAEAAQYLKEHGLTFSETGLEDLKEISSAAIGAVDHAVAARQDGGMEDIRQVSKLEDRVDTLEEEMRDKHIERLSKNECNPSAGVVFLDILSNLERISDHAYNVAGYVKDEL